MLRALLALIVLGAALSQLSSCEVCHQPGCSQGVRLTVLDSAGLPVDAFHGVAYLANGREVELECPTTGSSQGVSVNCVGDGRVVLFTDVPVDRLAVIANATGENAESDVRDLREQQQPAISVCGTDCYDVGTVLMLE